MGARFLQRQQTSPGRLHLLARASAGTNSTSNLGLHAKIRLPVPAALLAVQGEARIPGLSTLGQLGGIGLQKRGPQRQESANRKNSATLNRTFSSMMMTQTINRLTGICEQAAAQTWPDTSQKPKFDHVLRAFSISMPSTRPRAEVTINSRKWELFPVWRASHEVFGFAAHMENYHTNGV